MNCNVEFIDVHVTQDLRSGDFGHLIGRFRAILQDTCTRNRPVLPPVNDDYVRWFEIRLYPNPETSVRVRFRRDNLYLQGYQMGNSEQWLELGVQGRDPHLIDPNSTLLGFGHNYTDLLREAGYETLGDVSLGREALINAANSLANATQARLRARALLVVIQMFCESARFVDILSYLRNTFDRGSQVPGWMQDIVHRWQTYSDYVLFYDANPNSRWVPQQVPTAQGVITAQTVTELLQYIGILQRDPRTIGPPPSL